MPGFLDSLSGVLQSPAVQQLLPAALGAASGFLTTPRRAGAGGAIGNALGGAAQGITTGGVLAARTQELQQNAAHYALLNQQVARALQDRSTDQPVVAGMLNTIAQSPISKIFYGNQPPPDFSKVSPETGREMLKSQMVAFEQYMKGEKPTFQHVTGSGPDGKDHIYELTARPDGSVDKRDLGLASQESAQLRQQQMEATQAAREQTLAFEKSNAAMTHELAAGREADVEQNRFINAQNQLSKQDTDIQKLLSGATPSDPTSLATRVKQRNAFAKQLKAMAEKKGYVYDPASFEPMEVGKEPGAMNKLTGGLIPTEKTVLKAGESSAESSNLRTDDPIVGKATNESDGRHRMPNGRIYTVKDGKIIGYAGE